MNLPENFLFSQHKLHDYVECPRRFELRYLLGQEWPAIRSEPVMEMEEQMKLGQQFHLMAQQYFSGLSEKAILSQIGSPILESWWKRFTQFVSTLSIESAYPEMTLRGSLASFQFIAILDLLVYTPDGRFIIFDWKTNKKKIRRSILESHIQTRLYPLLFSKLDTFRGKPIDQEKLEMIYWFANDPENTEKFSYGENLCKSDYRYFEDLISDIEMTPEGEFMKTGDERLCSFCNYRSLCNRGIKAGKMEDDSNYQYDEVIEDIDLSQIAEIAF